MDNEREEILRLEREIEFYSNLINGHRNKSQGPKMMGSEGRFQNNCAAITEVSLSTSGASSVTQYNCIANKLEAQLKSSTRDGSESSSSEKHASNSKINMQSLISSEKMKDHECHHNISISESSKDTKVAEVEKCASQTLKFIATTATSAISSSNIPRKKKSEEHFVKSKLMDSSMKCTTLESSGKKCQPSVAINKFNTEVIQNNNVREMNPKNSSMTWKLQGPKKSTINKYKLVRPKNEVTSKHNVCQVDSIDSTSVLECVRPVLDENKRKFMQKSKYSLINSEQDELKMNSLISSSRENVVCKQLQKKYCTKASLSLLAASSARFKRSGKNSNSPVAFVSKYKMIKKAENQQKCSTVNKKKVQMQQNDSLTRMRRTKHENDRRHGSFSGTKKRSGWATKYALKREVGDTSSNDVCINKILGRKIRNLSSNKYKFINGCQRSVSPQSFFSKRNRNSISPQMFYRRKNRLRTDMKQMIPRSKWSIYSYSYSTMISYPISWTPLKQNRRLSFSSARRQSITDRKRRKNVNSSPGNPSRRYCIYYNRFGRCSRGDKCQYVHDPDKVSVCTRFLRGTCKVVDCQFSHLISKDKMPTCIHFLRRVCNRDNCPYSHVNVGKDAEICNDFIRGYCANGDMCKKKHTLICSEFERTGRCQLGENCRMNHFKKDSMKQQMNDKTDKVIVKKQKRSQVKSPVEECCNLKDRSATNKSDSSGKIKSQKYNDVNVPWKERKLPPFLTLEASETKDSEPTVNSTNPPLDDSVEFMIHPRLNPVHDDHFEMMSSIIQQNL